MSEHRPSSTSNYFKAGMAAFIGLYAFYIQASRNMAHDAAVKNDMLQNTLSDTRAMLREPETIHAFIYKENIVDVSKDTSVLETYSEPVFLVPLDRYMDNEKRRHAANSLLTP